MTAPLCSNRSPFECFHRTIAGRTPPVRRGYQRRCTAPKWRTSLAWAWVNPTRQQLGDNSRLPWRKRTICTSFASTCTHVSKRRGGRGFFLGVRKYLRRLTGHFWASSGLIGSFIGRPPSPRVSAHPIHTPPLAPIKPFIPAVPTPFLISTPSSHDCAMYLNVERPETSFYRRDLVEGLRSALGILR